MDRKHYDGKTVLVTGGTKGIGLAIAIEFARHGAETWVTHRWGSVEDSVVEAAFTAAGIKKKPRVVQADVSSEEDTQALLKAIKADSDGVEAFVSNVAFAQIVKSMDDYKKRSFLKSIEYGAWPLVGYTNEIHAVFGKYPKYVLGISSNATEAYHQNYDVAALGKAVMETMAKYMATRLRPHGTTVNILRPWQLKTDASLSTFGETITGLSAKLLPPGTFLTPEQVAKSAYGLCSGYFDHMSGQIIAVDGGGPFMDNVMGLLDRPEIVDVLSKLYGVPRS